MFHASAGEAVVSKKMSSFFVLKVRLKCCELTIQLIQALQKRSYVSKQNEICCFESIRFLVNKVGAAEREKKCVYSFVTWMFYLAYNIDNVLFVRVTNA